MSVTPYTSKRLCDSYGRAEVMGQHAWVGSRGTLTCTCMYTRIYIYFYIHARTYSITPLHAYKRIDKYTYKYIVIYSYTCTLSHTHPLPLTHTYQHGTTHALIYTHAYRDWTLTWQSTGSFLIPSIPPKTYNVD
jgi:hypothetical protein